MLRGPKAIPSMSFSFENDHVLLKWTSQTRPSRIFFLGTLRTFSASFEGHHVASFTERLGWTSQFSSLSSPTSVASLLRCATAPPRGPSPGAPFALLVERHHGSQLCVGELHQVQALKQQLRAGQRGVHGSVRRTRPGSEKGSANASPTTTPDRWSRTKPGLASKVRTSDSGPAPTERRVQGRVWVD